MLLSIDPLAGYVASTLNLVSHPAICFKVWFPYTLQKDPQFGNQNVQIFIEKRFGNTQRREGGIYTAPRLSLPNLISLV